MTKLDIAILSAAGFSGLFAGASLFIHTAIYPVILNSPDIR